MNIKKNIFNIQGNYPKLVAQRNEWTGNVEYIGVGALRRVTNKGNV